MDLPSDCERAVAKITRSFRSRIPPSVAAQRLRTVTKTVWPIVKAPTRCIPVDEELSRRFLDRVS